MSLDLVAAYPEADRGRVCAVLDALLPYLQGKYLIVGGTAIRYHLMAGGGRVPSRPFNDFDLIVAGPASLDPQINREFLVHHYHEASERSDFRLVFVHRATGTKIDVFHWKPKTPGSVIVPYESPVHGEGSVWLQDLPTQFAVTVYDLETMRGRGPVDPKQLGDALSMSGILRDNAANYAWHQLWEGTPPLPLHRALFDAVERAQDQPETFAAEPWKLHHTKYVCSKCVASLEWPIAPAQEIYDLLGYIEMDGSNVY